MILYFRNILLAFLFFALAFSIWSNPAESDYIERVANDYTSIHHGHILSPELLLETGVSQRQDYILFSLYTYSFGEIGVLYWGCFGKVIYVSSFSADPQTTFQKIQS